MSNKTDKIIEIAKKKSEETENKVVKVIKEMVKNEEKINFYSVYQKAGVSKSFVYNNPTIRELIEKYRSNPIKNKQTQDTKDVIIETQRKRIKELEKQLKNSVDYKTKYEKLLKENKELKKQLETAYDY